MSSRTRKKSKKRASGINSLELWLLGCTVTSYIGAFMWVGFTVKDWRRIEFIFACAVCVLIFIQFLIRYLAITHVYKTENTIGAWIVSFMIFVVSSVLVITSLSIPWWFLVFGILLLLASVKNLQSRGKIIASQEYDFERVMRLKEYMVMEVGFGFFMIFFAMLTVWGSRILSSITADSAVFFGTLFALFYAVVSTLIMLMRMINNRAVIEKHMSDLS
jgi:hypothetical protein